jgi:hypothetical protein
MPCTSHRTPVRSLSRAARLIHRVKEFPGRRRSGFVMFDFARIFRRCAVPEVLISMT